MSLVTIVAAAPLYSSLCDAIVVSRKHINQLSDRFLKARLQFALQALKHEAAKAE